MGMGSTIPTTRNRRQQEIQETALITTDVLMPLKNLRKFKGVLEFPRGQEVKGSGVATAVAWVPAVAWV